jgi:hypothetical protein
MTWRGAISRYGRSGALALVSTVALGVSTNFATSGGPGWWWAAVGASGAGLGFSGLWAYRRSPSCPLEAMGRTKYLGVVESLSDNRRANRRRGAGLDTHQVSIALEHHAAIPPELLGPFGPGSIRLLVGQLGSGKSECAEEWLYQKISQAKRSRKEPLPVWIGINDLSDNVETQVLADLGIDEVRRYGCCVVIDGLDERTDRAGSILRQAWQFVLRWPKCRILITSRALPSQVTNGQFRDDDAVEMPLLSRAKSRELLRSIASIDPGDLGEHLDEVLDRPLFVLLVARHATRVEGIAGVPGLIDAVVDSVVVSDGYAMYEYLRLLAANTIRAGTAVDPRSFATAEVAARIRASPLVTASNDRCAFALATFEQWFAAKSLLERVIDVAELLDSLETFDRWKYVLAMVLATGEPTHADRIMESVVRWNPGAASWIIRETHAGGLARPRPHLTPKDSTATAVRLRAVTAAWLDGLGPLAACFQPFWSFRLTDLDSLSVGVDIGERSLTVVWCPRNQGGSPHLPLILPTDGRRVGSMTARMHELPTGANWVWETIQTHLADDIGEHFASVALQVAEQEDGVVRLELEDLHRWREFRNRVTDPPPPADEWPDSLYPIPDTRPQSEPPFGGSTLNTMVERVNEVVAFAMRCYLELSKSVAPNFGETLALRGLMPVEFYGDIHFLLDPDVLARPLAAFGLLEPGIRYVFRPRSQVFKAELRPEDNVVSLSVNDESRSNAMLAQRDAIWDEFKTYVESRPAYLPFAGGCSITTGTIDVLATRPATRLALDWLSDDLKRLGLTKSIGRLRLPDRFG